MKYSELLRLLKKDGWYEVGQTGSHKKMRHHIKKGRLTVPFHGSKEVPHGTATNILKQAGIRRKS